MYYFKNRKELLYDGELYINMKKKNLDHTQWFKGRVCVWGIFNSPFSSAAFLQTTHINTVSK